MSIESVAAPSHAVQQAAAAAAPASAPPVAPSSTTASPAAQSGAQPARAQPIGPNPLIEFDASLRLVVFEYRNPQTHVVTRYPDVPPGGVPYDGLGSASSGYSNQTPATDRPATSRTVIDA